MAVAIPTQDTSTREDLGMLAVLEVLVDREQVSQRELSRQTGLYLKKVNYCLHKLVEKGHVKFPEGAEQSRQSSLLSRPSDLSLLHHVSHSSGISAVGSRGPAGRPSD